MLFRRIHTLLLLAAPQLSYELEFDVLILKLYKWMENVFIRKINYILSAEKKN